MKRMLVAGVALAVAAAGGMWAASASSPSSSRSPSPSPSASPSPAPSSGTAELTEFRDPAAGFALSYPTAWVRATAPNPQIVLVAAEHDPAKNQGGSILVRATPIDGPVGKAQLGEARKVTDAIVSSSDGLVLKAEPTETEQGGLPGLYYLYTFHDPVSGVTGVHSHFFLFKDKTMISLVLQALPQDDFGRLAPLFDRVAGSIRPLQP
jgi:hypothetical protein